MRKRKVANALLLSRYYKPESETVCMYTAYFQHVQDLFMLTQQVLLRLMGSIFQ